MLAVPPCLLAGWCRDRRANSLLRLWIHGPRRMRPCHCISIGRIAETACRRASGGCGLGEGHVEAGAAETACRRAAGGCGMGEGHVEAKAVGTARWRLSCQAAKPQNRQGPLNRRAAKEKGETPRECVSPSAGESMSSVRKGKVPDSFISLESVAWAGAVREFRPMRYHR